MPDWQSQTEIIKDGQVFSKFMHVLLGVYIWEWFTSLRFDWEYAAGKRPFRWPIIFYFLNRYCLLAALIGITIALNVTAPVNCQALYTFNSCVGNAAIGLASINLSLRTMAVWSQRWYICVPLVLIIMGHWSLLLHGILIHAAWIDGQGCAITDTDNTILAATFIYTMCFDFIVLSLTAWKLVIHVPKSIVMARSKLTNLIFGDGLIFFIIAFLSNLLATIFMLLNLNPVMSIIANVPAAISSTIVACRAVRRLSKYTSRGAEVFNSTQASTLAFRTTSNNGNGTNGLNPKRNPSMGSKALSRFGLSSIPNSGTGLGHGGLSKLDMASADNVDGDGVHVQMEIFESPVTPSSDYKADDFASTPHATTVPALPMGIPQDPEAYPTNGHPPLPGRGPAVVTFEGQQHGAPMVRYERPLRPPRMDEYNDPESEKIKSEFKRPPY